MKDELFAVKDFIIANHGKHVPARYESAYIQNAIKHSFRGNTQEKKIFSNVIDACLSTVLFSNVLLWQKRVHLSNASKQRASTK